eukprot:9476089-Pyramimonas_sp.AAC.1
MDCGVGFATQRAKPIRLAPRGRSRSAARQAPETHAESQHLCLPLNFFERSRRLRGQVKHAWLTTQEPCQPSCARASPGLPPARACRVVRG